MIYVIHYDRCKSETKAFIEFSDTQRSNAMKERLKLEKMFNLGEACEEIVLLEALDLDVLKKTHGKYFNKTVTQAGQTHY
jgi:hypothetical protein